MSQDNNVFARFDFSVMSMKDFPKASLDQVSVMSFSGCFFADDNANSGEPKNVTGLF